MKKLLAVIRAPFTFLKNLWKLFWSKALGRFFLVVAIILLAVHIYRTFGDRIFKPDVKVTTTSEVTTEATTTTAPSSEDIAAMVSEIVESQLAERLAEMDSTPSVTQAANTPTSTTVVPQEATTTVTTVKAEETIPIDSNVEDESVTEYGFITYFQANDSYTVPYMPDVYDASMYPTFCQNSGRDISIQIPDDITSISIAISFRDTDNNWSELSNFEELVLSHNENGTEAQYSIPDNPLRNDGYYDKSPRFCGVFRLETTDGLEYYFSISY